MNIERFTDTHQEVLKAVGKYQYLTVSHLVQLGICSSIQYMRRPVADLAKSQKPLLFTLNYGDHPAYGRREFMYCLTQRGVQALKEWGEPEEQIRRPRNARTAPQDYQHKKNMITALIEADKYQNVTILDFYYGRAKGSRKQATTVEWENKDGDIKSLSPDAILRRKNVLLSVEMTNGTSFVRDKGKVFSYLSAFRPIMRKYQHRTAPVVLFIYENEKTMHRFISWASKLEVLQSKNFADLFMVKSLESIKEEGFFKEWNVLGGDPKTKNFSN